MKTKALFVLVFSLSLLGPVYSSLAEQRNGDGSGMGGTGAQGEDSGIGGTGIVNESKPELMPERTELPERIERPELEPIERPDLSSPADLDLDGAFRGGSEAIEPPETQNK